ncbi:hypothetical protein NP493_2714g00001 [Ridgeia piscesae]|uniref:Uncharacterized protein n=1 Tax=Ridgeia piscesae TaxID=27915 RepID=A0AAD9N1L5_RIDPI|nr:hypothetical protein NP493_2714g00001 [Ridgeia piscesae]
MLRAHQRAIPSFLRSDIASVYSSFPKSSSLLTEYFRVYSLVAKNFRCFEELHIFRYTWTVGTANYSAYRHLRCRESKWGAFPSCIATFIL